MLPTVTTAVAALAVVLGLILSAAQAFRRWKLKVGQPLPSPLRQLVVQETIALDRVRRLHVIRCGSREVMLLTGGPTDLVVGSQASHLASTDRAA